MPINATIGQSIVFTAVFFDTSGATTTPSSATITVTYPPSSNSLTILSCAIGMTSASSSIFVATWSSSVAALGLSSYSVSAPGQVTPAPGSTGTLRLIS